MTRKSARGLPWALALAAMLASAPARAQNAGADWEGWYAGPVLGFAWTDVDMWAGPSALSDSYSGISGGAFGGYNFITGNFLAGFEADIVFADLMDDMSLARHKVSLVGRLGVLVTPTTLLYGVAGIAGGQYEAQVTTTTTTTTIVFDDDEVPILTTNTTAGSAEADKRLWGYTLGGGFEMVTNGFAVPVRIGVEYRYTNFEQWTFTVAGQGIAIEPTVQEVRGRLVFPFN